MPPHCRPNATRGPNVAARTGNHIVKANEEAGEVSAFEKGARIGISDIPSIEAHLVHELPFEN
jgi:hypothetical protein